MPRGLQKLAEYHVHHVGGKWSNLHNGAMWSVVPVEQGKATVGTSKPMDALVSIPGLSSRTLRKDIAASPLTTGPEIQTHSLDEAAIQHPDVWWWIMGDGCDVVSGLGESTRHIWSGDVDLADGKLQGNMMRT